MLLILFPVCPDGLLLTRSPVFCPSFIIYEYLCQCDVFISLISVCIHLWKLYMWLVINYPVKWPFRARLVHLSRCRLVSDAPVSDYSPVWASTSQSSSSGQHHMLFPPFNIMDSQHHVPHILPVQASLPLFIYGWVALRNVDHSINEAKLLLMWLSVSAFKKSVCKSGPFTT